MRAIVNKIDVIVAIVYFVELHSIQSLYPVFLI